MKILYNILSIIFFGIIASCCSTLTKDNSEILDTLTSVPLNNPITKAKTILGEKLFFDPRISKDSSISCASCHHPDKAFSDGIQLSNVGISKKRLKRNAPALFNLAWHNSFFWDGGKGSLENQAFAPLRHADEMSVNLDTLIDRLRKDEKYTTLFERAFEDGIQFSNLSKAIATFERTLTSFNSKFDRVMNKQEHFTQREKQGFRIFKNNCKSCHKPPFFTDLKFHNNGLNSKYPLDYNDPEQGRYRVSGKITDQGKFKTASLRNLSFTAPYMHDGRFSTLNEVLHHYTNPNPSKTLDTLLNQTIYLSINDKKNLLSFLKTLNDSTFSQHEYSY